MTARSRNVRPDSPKRGDARAALAFRRAHGYGSRRMLFDQEQHGRAMKVVAILLAVVFLLGMFVLGGVLLFT